jgi:hypothetical protein
MATTAPSARNRREHLRYRDPESTVLNFRVGEKGSERSFVGLIVNESFRGLSIVFVGDGQLQKGDSIFWEETPVISTPCTVIRCQRLDEDVYALALRIEG